MESCPFTNSLILPGETSMSAASGTFWRLDDCLARTRAAAFALLREDRVVLGGMAAWAARIVLPGIDA